MDGNIKSKIVFIVIALFVFGGACVLLVQYQSAGGPSLSSSSNAIISNVSAATGAVPENISQVSSTQNGGPDMGGGSGNIIYDLSLKAYDVNKVAASNVLLPSETAKISSFDYYVGYVTAEPYLNLRTKPDVNSEVIAKLPTGLVFKNYPEHDKDGWWFVTFSIPNRLQFSADIDTAPQVVGGWVSREHVLRNEEGLWEMYLQHLDANENVVEEESHTPVYTQSAPYLKTFYGFGSEFLVYGQKIALYSSSNLTLLSQFTGKSVQELQESVENESVLLDKNYILQAQNVRDVKISLPWVLTKSYDTTGEANAKYTRIYTVPNYLDEQSAIAFAEGQILSEICWGLDAYEPYETKSDGTI